MSELVEQVARAIAGPMQDAWQEFMTEAEAALSVLEPRIAQQAEEVARLRRVVKGWADWYRLADGDPDCDYLNGKGWDDAEALADMSLAATAEEAKRRYLND